MKYLEVKLHYVYNYFKNTSENKRKKCFKTKKKTMDLKILTRKNKLLS